MPSSLARNNDLLAALPPNALQQLVAAAEICEVKLKQQLHTPDTPITHVYFPVTAVVSLLSPAGRNRIEVATVGPEGMVGVPVFLGGSESFTYAVAQVPGTTIRVSAGVVRQLADLPEVRQALGSYTQALIALISQSVACNRVHSVEARCARWLLITRDRARSTTFPVTQQFLAQMLGVRRASVTVAAGALQKRGLIQYTRGKVTILDGAGLERASCECYRVVADRYHRVLPPSAQAVA